MSSISVNYSFESESPTEQSQRLNYLSRDEVFISRLIQQSLDESTSDLSKSIHHAWSRQDFLLKLMEQMEVRYSDPDFKMNQVAKHIAMSERQLYRSFRQLFKITPGHFLRHYRLEKALWMIRQGEALGNVAFNVGFSSHSYFSRCFKNTYGHSPSDVVKQQMEQCQAE